MTEFAYVEAQDAPWVPTMMDWTRGKPAFADAQIALKAARAKLGPKTTILIAEIELVDAATVTPPAEQVLADIKERLVDKAGYAADRKLDELSADQMAAFDTMLAVTVGQFFSSNGIDFDAFIVRNTKRVIAGQAWA